MDRIATIFKGPIDLSRLYRIELEELEIDTWTRRVLLHDLQGRSISEIIDEVNSELAGKSGKWRVSVYYWAGQIVKPASTRIMGKGESFLYNYNPRGDVVMKLEPIEIDMDNK